MGKISYLVIIVLTAGLGWFLTAGYGSDDRGCQWVRGHLHIVQNQLTGLKTHLLKHRQVHGRYPTNDEGLAALDNFEARVETYLYRSQGRGPEGLPRPLMGSFLGFWGSNRETVKAYRSMRNPRKARRNLLMLLGCSEKPLDEKELQAKQVEEVETVLAIGEGDNIFVLGHPGVLSPWLIPYVYENRKGSGQAKFEGSPVDCDKEGRYSVRVDDGVYVSSIGGQRYAKRLARMWWEFNWPRFAGGGLLLVAVVFLGMMIRASRRTAKAGAAAMLVSAVVGLGAHAAFHASCYVMSPFFSRRDREMVAQQKELLDKYHSRGVIGDKAYERALLGLERGPSTQPASAPDGPD